MPSNFVTPGRLGCRVKAEEAKKRPLDALKLIEVLQKMEREQFFVSVPALASKYVYNTILQTFGLNENAVAKIINASVNETQIGLPAGKYPAPDGIVKRYPAQVLVLPEALTIADFDDICAHQERFYQKLAAFRKGMHNDRAELDREIAVIHKIMDNVLGVEAPKKDCPQR